MPGASEVKMQHFEPAGDSSVRQTIRTPSSGKKIRLVSISGWFDNATGMTTELYFGTGANIGTNKTKASTEVWIDLTDFPSFHYVWPDGGGPVGAADDVLSVRSSVNTGNHKYVAVYREE